MIFSYNWLKEFVPNIPDPKTLLDQLTLHSVEVEGITDIGKNLDGVVVAQLLEKRKHANADKLNIGLFDVGEEKPRQIIFGGKAVLNVGDKLSVALAPTKLPGDIKIEQKKLRGELSQGMCCLNSEIGILNNAAEVHFFPADTKPGTKITEVLKLKQDTLLDIDNKSMTHRADLFCHRGLAREIAAVFELDYQLPTAPKLPVNLPELNVKIEAPELCPRYIAAKLDVQVGPTPDFIREKLLACNIKSINNVVDITNYVMIEYGQPLHAFDADKVDGGIIIRLAHKTESLRTLNDAEGAETKLNQNILVIADSEKPLAIAGVIGGRPSAISDTTQHIILEAATFDAVAVRQAAQAIGVRTDSVLRFEKGLSAQLPTLAAARAVELLVKYADGRITDYTDRRATDDTDKMQIQLSSSYLERVTGQNWDAKLVKVILERLECKVEINKDHFTITPPWFRKDLEIPEDVIEEIVRLYGVEKLPQQPLVGKLEVPQSEPEFMLGLHVKNVLQNLGLTETYNYSFYGEDFMKKVGLKEADHIAIANPLSEDLRFLRTTLLPRLFENVARNQFHAETLNLFEVGHVYFQDREVRQVAIVVADKDNAYRKVRGYVEALLKQLNVNFDTKVIEQSAECSYWGMYAGSHALSCYLAPKSPKGDFQNTSPFRGLGGQNLGTIGELSSDILNNLNIQLPVAFAVLSIPVLEKNHGDATKMKPILPYPAIQLDLSIIVPQQIMWSELEQVIRNESKELLQSINVFDVYQGEKIPAGKKSIAFHLILQSQEHTLEMQAMEQLREQIMQKLTKQFNAELRAK